MLGLRYFACPDCDAVHALPEDPGACDRCGATGLDAVPSGSGAAAYFTRGLRDGSD